MSHTVALIGGLGGAVYTWGRNQYGQLGIDDLTDHPQPVGYKFHSGVEIACGHNFSAVLNRQGQVYYCGRLAGRSRLIVDASPRPH